MTIDIGIVACLVIATIFGFKDGFFRKLYSILVLLGAICLALWLYGWVGEWFTQWFDMPIEMARIAAFGALFIIFIVIMNVIYRMLGEEKFKTIKIWSRFLGGGIGLFQGALVASLLLIILTKIGYIDDIAIKESNLYNSFIDFAPKVMRATMRWLPKAQDFIKEIKGKL